MLIDANQIGQTVERVQQFQQVQAWKKLSACEIQVRSEEHLRSSERMGEFLQPRAHQDKPFAIIAALICLALQIDGKEP